MGTADSHSEGIRLQAERTVAAYRTLVAKSREEADGIAIGALGELITETGNLSGGFGRPFCLSGPKRRAGFHAWSHQRSPVRRLTDGRSQTIGYVLVGLWGEGHTCKTNQQIRNATASLTATES
jgi:hypothetical protein